MQQAHRVPNRLQSTLRQAMSQHQPFTARTRFAGEAQLPNVRR